jgi:hypothetical protein
MKKMKLFYFIFIGIVIISCSKNNEIVEKNQEDSFPANSNNEYLQSVITDNRYHPSLGIVIEEFIIYQNNKPIYRLIDLDYKIENQDDYDNIQYYGKADEIHKYIYGTNNKVKETRVYKNPLYAGKFEFENNRIFDGSEDITEDNSKYSIFYHEYNNALIEKILTNELAVEYVFDGNLNLIKINKTMLNGTSESVLYTNIEDKIEILRNDYDNEETNEVYTHNYYLNPYYKLLIDFGILTSSSASELPNFGLEWQHKYFVEGVYYDNNIIELNKVLNANNLNYSIETIYKNTFLTTPRREKILYIYK